MGGYGYKETSQNIYDGKVLQIWDDELVDPYVQTLDSKDGVVYIGTYQGLDRLSGQTLEHLLPAWSVFSLLTDGNKTAVGYEGITFIDEKGKVSTQDWPGNVDAIAQVGDALWMATETKGLVQSTKEGTQGLSDEPINDILQIEDRVYVAGDSWVWSLPDQPTEDDELKGEVVGRSLMYTLADYHDQLWVGTSDGLSSFAKEPGKRDKVSQSHWSTTQTIYSLLPTEEYGLLASLEYRFIPMSIQGERLPLRLLEDNVSEAKLHQDSNGIWVWSFARALQIQNNALSKSHTLPSHLVGITEWLGNTWLAAEDGLYKLSDADFSRELEREGIQEIASDGRTMWFRSDTGCSSSHPQAPWNMPPLPPPPLPFSPSGLTLCVGTEDGLFRLWKGREERQDVREPPWFSRPKRGDCVGRGRWKGWMLDGRRRRHHRVDWGEWVYKVVAFA